MYGVWFLNGVSCHVQMTSSMGRQCRNTGFLVSSRIIETSDAGWRRVVLPERGISLVLGTRRLTFEEVFSSSIRPPP